MTETQLIDIEQIEQNESQPRKYFDKDKLEALKRSIKKDGLLQPIVVRSIKEIGRYQLVAGECRYRALKELGEKTVPAVVVDADDKKALDLASKGGIRGLFSGAEEDDGLTRITARFFIKAGES